MKRPQASIRSTSFRVRRASDRGHWSEAKARAILAGWDPRQQSLGAYARSRGERAGRLAYWVAKFEAVRAPSSMLFLPVVVKSPAWSAPSLASSSRVSRQDFEIVLTSGHRVRVPTDFDPGALRRLVQALEAVPPC